MLVQYKPVKCRLSFIKLCRYCGTSRAAALCVQILYQIAPTVLKEVDGPLVEASDQLRPQAPQPRADGRGAVGEVGQQFQHL